MGKGGRGENVEGETNREEGEEGGIRNKEDEEEDRER